MTKYWLGKKMSDEHRRKLSEAHKGQKQKKGMDHHSWKGGRSNCTDCGVETSSRTSVRCRACVDKHKAGERAYNWKGDLVGMDALHRWVERNLGKPNKCEFCETLTAKKYDWANKDHKYLRSLNDFIRLCRPCHRKYDILNNGYPAREKTKIQIIKLLKDLKLIWKYKKNTQAITN